MRKLIVPKEFLGAFKCGHRANSREFVDEEFSWVLLARVFNGDEEARAALNWLTRFNNEYHKAVIKKGDPQALHNTDELRRDCNRRNYSRRNDVFAIARRFCFVDNYDEILEKENDLEEP